LNGEAMNNAGQQFAAIAVAIIGVAIIAVLVSRNAQTAGVIQAAGSAFSGILGTALGPVTGQTSGSSSGGASYNPFAPAANQFGG